MTDQSQSITSIAKYHDNDVLCGRGCKFRCHAGNQYFISLVKELKAEYATAKKGHGRHHFVKTIVKHIRSLNPPGRFLKKCEETQLWNDIGDRKAIRKTAQALREVSPKIAKNLTAGKIDSKKKGVFAKIVAQLKAAKQIPDDAMKVFGADENIDLKGVFAKIKAHNKTTKQSFRICIQCMSRFSQNENDALTAMCHPPISIAGRDVMYEVKKLSSKNESISSEPTREPGRIVPNTLRTAMASDASSQCGEENDYLLQTLSDPSPSASIISKQEKNQGDAESLSHFLPSLNDGNEDEDGDILINFST